MKNNYKVKQLTAALLLSLTPVAFVAQQTSTLDFETFTLSAGSSYSPGTSTPFQSGDASFQHRYTSYWSGGFAYTAVTDSSNGSYTNLYGVRAYKGYANSSVYVVGQHNGVIRLTAAQSTVNGLYVTNTTYAYKTILQGNQFSRKFGDTTGTGSGTTIPQGAYPDYFKLVVRGYKNGSLKTDSATFMLADYTYTNSAQDNVVNTWQYLSTANIGEVDSLVFRLRSTDVGAFGMNTPAFFAIDNVVLSKPGLATSLDAAGSAQALSVFPNPFNSLLNICTGRPLVPSTVRLRDLNGRLIYEARVEDGQIVLDLSSLERGVYLLELVSGEDKLVKRVVRQ